MFIILKVSFEVSFVGIFSFLVNGNGAPLSTLGAESCGMFVLDHNVENSESSFLWVCVESQINHNNTILTQRNTSQSPLL